MFGTKRLFAASLLVIAFATSAHAQTNLIINGDFEINTAGGTMFNMSNAVFNATVSAATAFGSAQEIDLITGAPYGSPPQSGNWKLAIHTQASGINDAFSFNLSSSVVAGQTYTLSFFAQSVLDFDPNLANVQVGLSASATSFGTQVFAGIAPSSAGGWTHFTSTFVAPISAPFLTVQTDPNVTSAWAHIDNFSLTTAAVPEPATIALFAVSGAGLLLTVKAKRALRRKMKT